MPYLTNQPTPITNANRIDFVGSPTHIVIDSNLVSNFQQVQSVYLNLWIWSGDLNKPYSSNSKPTKILFKNKISKSDNYISFEVGDIIASYIKPSVKVRQQVTFISGEGVYWQYEIMVVKKASPQDQDFYEYIKPPTRFATLGYNWDYEGENTFTNNRGSFGFRDSNIPKYYSSSIKYYTTSLNLVNATNTDDMIVRTLFTPPSSYLKCTPEQYVIVYLNKMGLFDTFTPFGKSVVSNKIERESFNRTFRLPSRVDQSLEHQAINFNISNKQSYVINTGILDELMGELVEEIINSRKVFLVYFKALDSEGLTVDTTFVTTDSILFTADNSTKDNTSYVQIPVVVSSNDFERKTRLNDRSKISYTLKFDAANFKINNLK